MPQFGYRQLNIVLRNNSTQILREALVARITGYAAGWGWQMASFRRWQLF
jgi:hypothetical protein